MYFIDYNIYELYFALSWYAGVWKTKNKMRR
jgi:hypothetical protein